MTIHDLLEKIENLKKANLLRDESQVEFVVPEDAALGKAFDVESAGREGQDWLTLRA